MGKQNNDTTAVPRATTGKIPPRDRPARRWRRANDRLTGNGSRGANSSGKTAAAPSPKQDKAPRPNLRGLSSTVLENLMERGRTPCSTRTSSAATPLDIPSSTDGAAPGPMPRALKDPSFLNRRRRQPKHVRPTGPQRRCQFRIHVRYACRPAWLFRQRFDASAWFRQLHV